MKFKSAMIAIFLLLGMVFTLNAHAANKYPDPNRQTWFNNLTDALATSNEDSQDAAQIKRARQRAREKARQREINRAQSKLNQQ